MSAPIWLTNSGDLGIIPEQDMKELNKMGVGELFPPGTNTSTIAKYIMDCVSTHRDF